MRNRTVPLTLLAVLSCAVGGVSTATAQQAKPDSETRSAERNRADAERASRIHYRAIFAGE